jgi:hypothetical protein
MGMVCIIAGGGVLWFWLTSMRRNSIDRPMAIKLHGEKIGIAGLALVLLGAYLLFAE